MGARPACEVYLNDRGRVINVEPPSPRLFAELFSGRHVCDGGSDNVEEDKKTRGPRAAMASGPSVVHFQPARSPSSKNKEEFTSGRSQARFGREKFCN